MYISSGAAGRVACISSGAAGRVGASVRLQLGVSFCSRPLRLAPAWPLPGPWPLLLPAAPGLRCTLRCLRSSFTALLRNESRALPGTRNRALWTRSDTAGQAIRCCVALPADCGVYPPSLWILCQGPTDLSPRTTAFWGSSTDATPSLNTGLCVRIKMSAVARPCTATA